MSGVGLFETNTVYPEIFTVCIFHDYVLCQDFRVLTFTDATILMVFMVYFMAEDVCSRPHSYKGSELIFTPSIIQIAKVHLNQVIHNLCASLAVGQLLL